MLATSPLLEAFGNAQVCTSKLLCMQYMYSSVYMLACGNAQTVMNNNSSRYGKFLMLQFDLSGRYVVRSWAVSS